MNYDCRPILNPRNGPFGRSKYKIFWHTPPYGTQFFHFHLHFHQKAPTSEVHAHQKRVHTPYESTAYDEPWENI